MLNMEDLKSQIKYGLSEIYRPAVEQIVLMMFPEKTQMGDEMAENISKAFDDMTSEPMADILAAAIDYYVKNISISGMLITSGSPGTHTCTISPADKPIKAGKIPNTLGIS